MNILVIHEVSYLNKVVYEWQEIPEQLAKRGHNVTVINFDTFNNGKFEDRIVSKVNIAKVRLIDIPYLPLPLITYFSARYNYQKLLKELIKKEKIDLVFLYSIFINGINTVKICMKNNIPVVYRILDKYHILQQNILTKYPLYFGEKFVYRNADHVCSVNQKLLDYAIELSGNKIKNHSVIKHSVNTETFYPMPKDIELSQKYNISENDKVILFLGTLYDFSRLDLLIENYHKILDRIPSLKFLIVGEGVLYETLLELVNRHNLHDKVILTGVQDFSLVPGFISLADITINAFQSNDITKDIVPIKNLQYLACGKPVISTPLKDVVKFLPENESGSIYIDFSNIDNLIDKLIYLFENKNELAKLSKNGYNYILNNYSHNKQMDELESLFRSLVKD